MSANNYLLIEEQEKNRFQVLDMDMESNSGFPVKFSSFPLKKAIELAQSYMNENIVEYGISFKFKKNKKGVKKK